MRKEGIFQQENGYWWMWSLVTPDRASSLRTKDEKVAQRKYAEQVKRMAEFRAARVLTVED